MPWRRNLATRTSVASRKTFGLGRLIAGLYPTHTDAQH